MEPGRAAGRAESLGALSFTPVNDVRQVLADAQAAEARGEKSEAISLLKRAAEIYRDAGNHNRALKMLRHIRRLEGIEELEVLEGGSDGAEPSRAGAG